MDAIRAVICTVLIYLAASWLQCSYDPMKWSGLVIIIAIVMVLGVWENAQDD